MASTDLSTSSSQLSTAASEDHKRMVDEAFLNKMKSLVERLRLENATLKNSLDVERSGVRALKAQHEATMRNLKTEHRKREELLDKQLRVTHKPEKLPEDSLSGNQNVTELKKLTSVIQTLKTSNKSLQEKLKVAKTAESARAAELRAQAAKHAALEQAGIKDARAQCHKLLEEIKSKERVIIQLRRESARVTAALEYEQTQRMEGTNSGFTRNIRIDQGKEKTNREDLKTDIQHRKETFYRETPSDGDSAVSSAPSSLSPQPSADMWSCVQCRGANERAAVSARECSRLTDALRDARDQLELMEFRLLELEDAAPDKGARDNLTDSDSGCVSPGSRIKDSASPELKRMDSGYKSPNAPSSPCVPRRNLNVDYKEEFARAQVLADILDKNSEATSDSLKSNPVKEHLEQMILNAGSAEDRGCLEQVLMLLYNYQALSSSVSEDDCYQIKPKKLYDLRSPKSDADKTQKVIATVSPYSQQSLKGKFESLDNFGDNEVRKPTNLLQESGIFEDVESESKCTQTDNETFEFTGELNTEIQRLNSIREKLEKQGVRHKTSIKLQDEKEGLECKCVKLGKRHKQYYERRLKFLEGKISIYEAAQDVREAKLSHRLQNEFILETRVEELESQLSELHDKYERLEEDCCELEEIENDTRLHWQQLEMDYELCTAQLRDMTEQRECSRAQAERLMAEATRRETELKSREVDLPSSIPYSLHKTELLSRLRRLERAVPAIIVWNCVQVLGASISAGGERALHYRMTPYSSDTKTLISQVKQQSARRKSESDDTTVDMDTVDAATPSARKMEKQIVELIAEKRKIENHTEELKKKLNDRIKQLENELETAQRQIVVAECGAGVKTELLENKIDHLQNVILQENKKEKIPADPHLTNRLHDMLKNEEDLKNRIAELEKREGAYLEMLTQADDMWAEMEGGYKKKIEEANEIEGALKGKVSKLEEERDQWRKSVDPLKKKLHEVEESESSLRIALDKSERDNIMLRSKNVTLVNEVTKADGEIKKAEHTCKELDKKFKNEIEQLRKHNTQLNEDIKNQKEYTKKSEATFAGDLECIRRELNRTCKNAAEMEVTNSELKEEVESLEKQLSLTQKALSNCKRKCDEKIKTLSHELSIKTEELEEMRSEAMRQLQSSRIELKPDRTEYIDEGYTICTAVPKKIDYGRMHHSMSYLTSDTKCSCPTLRSQLVGNLIEDLFDRIHNTSDEDLTRLCKDMGMFRGRIENSLETKAKITNYLLMAISKELVRSIGDADAKTDTEEWQRAVSSVTYSVPNLGSDFSSLRLEGNAGVVRGAARLASVSCACAAAKLCAAVPHLADTVKTCQEEVLDHSDVKIMEEQLANAIESIVNCPSCALGTNAIVWSTDV